MSPEPAHSSSTTQEREQGAALALLPIAATLDYYALPESWQAQTLVQFTPQIIGYLAFALWAAHNRPISTRLGLSRETFFPGVRLGLVTGLILGALNSLVILVVFPSFGYDITFLKETPHAKIPLLIMMPWFIIAIACFVEINFRGFLLQRLASLESSLWKWETLQRLTPLAISVTSLVFAFDPFMTRTFQHLHWIAVWDGIVWGVIVMRTGHLWAAIAAHAVEVIVMYSMVRYMLVA